MSESVDYEIDNDKLVGELITSNWSLSDITPNIYYLEEQDPTGHNFGENAIAIKVYVGNVKSDPLGIAYDSERLSRTFKFDVMGIKRETVISASNELRRILAEHRFMPFGYWQVIEYTAESSKLKKNTYNCWEKEYVYTAILPYHPLPKRLII